MAVENESTIIVFKNFGRYIISGSYNGITIIVYIKNRYEQNSQQFTILVFFKYVAVNYKWQL